MKEGELVLLKKLHPSMKKFITLLAFAFPGMLFAQPIVSNAIVSQYVEGNTATNNNRIPFWFWGDISGFTPGATYHYYCALDTLNPAPASLGAGNPYFVNPVSGVIRRSANASMTLNTGYDSLVADANGHLKAWFGIEPTGSARFTPGRILCPKIMLNNGAGGTLVTTKLDFAAYHTTVLNFGTSSLNATQGSALYDSLNAATKNFICIYDNTTATGRPISIAIVENDGMMIKQLPSTATFYKNKVDSLNFHWGTIIPNNLANGVRALEERAFLTGAPIDTVRDADGIWCFGTNTVNMVNGTTPLYLNSTFVLTASAIIPDTTWTGINTVLTASSNSPNSIYTWDFGDAASGTGASANHTYLTPGVVNVQVVISTGGCSITINQTMVVMLSTGIVTPMPLSFQLMPNPTSGEIYVVTKDNNEKLITVTDLLGQTISSQVLTGNKVSVDLTGQTPGVYLVSVSDKVTGKTGVKKIVLQ